MSIKPDEKGHVTFFNIIKSGFFSYSKSTTSSAVNIDLNNVFNALYNWLKEPDRSFQNTSPLDKKDGRLDTKTYCKSVYKCPQSNDLFFVLWKSATDGNGNIQGVDPNAVVNDVSNHATLLDEKDIGGKLIWGLPSYYWYIAELNIFATIKFPHSCIDKKLFERYIRDFVLFRMDGLPTKQEFEINKTSKNEREFQYYQVTFGNNNDKFRFTIESTQLVKKSGKQYFAQFFPYYNFIVIRDTISASDSENKKCWFNSLVNIGSLFSTKNAANIKEKKIEVIMPSELNESSLEDIFDYYDERGMSSSDWNDIGFRESRESATKWCNEYIARDFIPCNITDKDEDKHLSAFKLCEIINQNRKKLLQGLSESKDIQLQEIMNKEQQKKQARKERNIQKIA